MWEAVLSYFGERCPDSLAGHFPTWLSRTFSEERADRAFRVLFHRFDRCTVQECLLSAFAERMHERTFSNLGSWASTRVGLSTDLLTAWIEQLPSVENYGCSQRVMAAAARVFARGARGDATWARLHLKCLLRHRLPPSSGGLAALPPEVLTSLHVTEGLPLLLQFIAVGLEGVERKWLKGFTRKKTSHPMNHPGLFLALFGIQGLLAHPEWEGALANTEVAVDFRLLGGALEILYHLPESRLQRISGESLRDYARRLPPLAELRGRGGRAAEA